MENVEQQKAHRQLECFVHAMSSFTEKFKVFSITTLQELVYISVSISKTERYLIGKQ